MILSPNDSALKSDGGATTMADAAPDTRAAILTAYETGRGGFRVRATRIEVGYAIDGVGRPEFIGAVRSAPRFRQEGAWSAVRMPGPSNPHPDAEAVTIPKRIDRVFISAGAIRNRASRLPGSGPILRRGMRFATN
jgi:hypothetical protein